jgi:hypothetical protein
MYSSPGLPNQISIDRFLYDNYFPEDAFTYMILRRRPTAQRETLKAGSISWNVPLPVPPDAGSNEQAGRVCGDNGSRSGDHGLFYLIGQQAVKI